MYKGKIKLEFIIITIKNSKVRIKDKN